MKKNQEIGSISLTFVLGVLPLLMVLAVIGPDLARYYYILDIQQDNYDLALRQKILNLETHSLSQRRDTNFSSFFASFFGGNSIKQSFATKVKQQKQNVVLVFDKGKTFAENPFEYSSETIDSQFARDYFLDHNLNYLGSTPGLVTQLCFNSLYTEYKLFALEIINSFRRRNDSLAVTLTPERKSLSKNLEFNHLFQGQEVCAGIAGYENYNSEFNFPINNITTESIISYDDLTYNQNFSQYLNSKSSYIYNIWSQSVTPDKTISLDTLMQQSVTKLIANQGLSKTELNNKLILLLGSFGEIGGYKPESDAYFNALTKVLNGISELGFKIKIYFIIFKSQNELNQQNTEVREFLDNFSFPQESLVKLETFVLDYRNYKNNIVEQLVNEGQKIVIAK